MKELDFKLFATAVQNQFNSMVALAAKGEGILVRTNTTNPYELAEFYVDAYPTEVNPIFRERRVYDGSYDKRFVRQLGDVVLWSKDLQTIQTIWDIEGEELGYFLTVARKMQEKVIARFKVESFTPFVSAEKEFGNEPNMDDKSDILWNHFYALNGDKRISSDVHTVETKFINNRDLLIKGLTQASIDNIENVLCLISENGIYRGNEFEAPIRTFLTMKKAFVASGASMIAFATYMSISGLLKKDHDINNNCLFINTAIGTLFQEMFEGKDVENAVKSFESKVAPANYKRTTAIVSPKMVEKAITDMKDIGIDRALYRQGATMQDVPLSSIIYQNLNQYKASDALDALLDESKTTQATKKIENQETQPIDLTGLNYLLKGSSKVRLAVNKALDSNRVLVTKPLHEDAPNIFRWNNGFSWAYVNGVADAIKLRVKEMGGCVDAPFRISLAWHCADDLDLKLITPTGQKVSFGNKKVGNIKLDLDMNAYGKSDPDNPVENIFSHHAIPDGKYSVHVNNYNKRGGSTNDTSVQVYVDGVSTIYHTGKSISNNNEKMMSFTMKNGYMIDSKLEAGWTVSSTSGGSLEFIDIEMITLSPNNWDAQDKVQHLLVFPEKMELTDKMHGFFVENLKGDLQEHKRTLELLSNRLLVEPKVNDLVGYGFNIGAKQEILLEVDSKLYKFSI